MSDAVCTNCGGKLLPNARFCRFCGEKVSEVEHRQPEPVMKVESPAKVQPEFEEITEDVIEQLFARERHETIKDDLRASLADMEEIEKKLEIGLISGDEARETLAKTGKKIEALKTEKANLPAASSLPIENLLENQKKEHGRIEKLKTMQKAGKIESDSVYRKLQGEYNEKLKQIETDLQNERRKIRHWVTELEKDVKKLKEDRESLQVKAELEGLSNIESEKEDLSKKITKRSVATKILRGLVS